MSVNAAPLMIGVSLKMYFGHDETLRWSRQVAQIAAEHPAVARGRVEIVVLPSFPALAHAAQIFDTTPVRLGAQNLFWEDVGAFTGEVSGRYLHELGCRYVEIGHAERRRIFAEDATVVQAKVDAAVRNTLTPIICVGERERVSAAEAAAVCIGQLAAALANKAEAAEPETVEPETVETLRARIVAAYEPVWAIGAENPAPIEHIAFVCAAIKQWLTERDSLAGSQVIYGGSAGPGLLTQLGHDVDGLFLGRFAHDPHSVAGILDEALQLSETRPKPRPR